MLKPNYFHYHAHLQQTQWRRLAACLIYYLNSFLCFCFFFFYVSAFSFCRGFYYAPVNWYKCTVAVSCNVASQSVSHFCRLQFISHSNGSRSAFFMIFVVGRVFLFFPSIFITCKSPAMETIEINFEKCGECNLSSTPQPKWMMLYDGFPFFIILLLLLLFLPFLFIRIR